MTISGVGSQVSNSQQVTSTQKFTGKEILEALELEGKKLPAGTTIIETKEYTEDEVSAILNYNNSTRDSLATLFSNFSQQNIVGKTAGELYATNMQYIDMGSSTEEFLDNIMSMATDYVNKNGNNDGNLDLEEFKAYNSSIMTGEDAEKIFNTINVDKKNGITADEFAAFLAAIDSFDSANQKTADGKINLGTYLYYTKGVNAANDAEGIKKITDKTKYFHNKFFKNIGKADTAAQNLSSSQKDLYAAFNTTQKTELGKFVTSKTTQEELDAKVNQLTKDFVKATKADATSDAVMTEAKSQFGTILNTLAGGNGISAANQEKLINALINALPQSTSKIDNIDTWAESFCTKNKITDENDKAAIKNALKELADTEGTNNKTLSNSDISHMTLAFALIDDSHMTADNLVNLSHIVSNFADVKADTGYVTIAAEANKINGQEASYNLESNIKIIKSADKIDNNGQSTEWTKNERNVAGGKILNFSASTIKANNIERSLSPEQKKMFATFTTAQKAEVGKFALETNKGNPSQAQLDSKVDQIAKKMIRSIKNDDESNAIMNDAAMKLGPMLSTLSGSETGLSAEIQNDLLTDLSKALPKKGSTIGNIDTWVDTFCSNHNITADADITAVRNAVSALADSEGKGNKELSQADISHMILASALLDDSKATAANIQDMAKVISEYSDVPSDSGYATIAAKANELNGLDSSASLESAIKIVRAADYYENKGISTEWTNNERNRTGLKIIQSSLAYSKSNVIASDLSTEQQKFFASFNDEQKAEVGKFALETNKGNPSQTQLDAKVNEMTKKLIKSVKPDNVSQAVIADARTQMSTIVNILTEGSGLALDTQTKLMSALKEALPEKTSTIPNISTWADTFCSKNNITDETEKAAVKNALQSLADTEGTGNKDLSYKDISHMTLAFALLDYPSADNLKEMSKTIQQYSDVKNDTGYASIAAKAGELNGYDDLENNIKVIKSADKIDNNAYSTEWTSNERNVAGKKIIESSATYVNGLDSNSYVRQPIQPQVLYDTAVNTTSDTVTNNTSTNTTVTSSTLTNSTGTNTTVTSSTITNSTGSNPSVNVTITVNGTTKASSVDSVSSSNTFDFDAKFGELERSRNASDRDSLRYEIKNAIIEHKDSSYTTVQLLVMLKNATNQSLHNEQLKGYSTNLATQWITYENEAKGIAANNGIQYEIEIKDSF